MRMRMRRDDIEGGKESGKVMEGDRIKEERRKRGERRLEKSKRKGKGQIENCKRRRKEGIVR